MIARDRCPFEQNGTSGVDYGGASASRAMGSQILVAGSTSGSWAMENAGRFDFAAVLVDITPNPNPSLAPTTSTETPFPRLSYSPATTENGGGLNITTMLAVLSCALGLVVIAGAGWACRRRTRKRGDAGSSGVGDFRTRDKDSHPPPSGSPSQGEDSYPLFVVQPKRSVTGDTQSASFRTIPDGPGVGDEDFTTASLPVNDVRGKATCEIGNKRIQVVHQSSATASAGEGPTVPPTDAEEAGNGVPEAKGSENSPVGGRRKSVRGIGVAQAVLGAAHELARMSQFPGVTELAGLVIVLMNMVNDKSDIIGVADTMIKRCRSVLFLLQRAASVLQEVRGDVSRCSCKLRSGTMVLQRPPTCG